MATKPETKTAEGFVGSVFKYSISTFVNIGIMGMAMLLTARFIPEHVSGEINLFISWTTTIMNFAIIGLDQALIRFYNSPPAGLSKNGLFRVCVAFSGTLLVVAGIVCSTFLQAPIYNAIGFTTAGLYIVPFLFINAFFYMVLRYFNVLYRMEMNIPVYSAVVILTQFFLRLFFLLGYVFGKNSNPVVWMMAFSVAGLGGFALVFSLLRPKMFRLQRAELTGGAYGTLLPFGVAIAPTALLLTFNSSFSQSFISNTLGATANGVYTMGVSLSNIVAMVQVGFASFWGAYMYQNYKTEQKRIMRVHDYLNFIILVFFCLLVAFQDILFWILQGYQGVRAIFPVMMLSAVFTILCETTVYGNSISKRPIFDTIGWALAFVANIALLNLLVRPGGGPGILGGAIALAGANLVMFIARTIPAQKFYKSIPNPGKTVVAMLLAVAVAYAGTVLVYNYLYKGLVCLAAICIYCFLYRKQLGGLWRLGVSILKGLFKRKTV